MIYYINRQTGKREVEKIFGERFIRLLYDHHRLKSFFGSLLRWMFNKNALFSRLYGYYQSSSWSRGHIQPFIEKYQIDVGEFKKSIKEFSSFNDFFIRELKPECRPVAKNDTVLIAPADGRYWVCHNLQSSTGFVVKNQHFSLSEFLNDPLLAKHYENGAMVIIRLCPTDYHRFHFPAGGKISPSRLVNGYLHSVNPLAIKKNIHIFAENKRMISFLDTDHFGRIAMIEVGATCVGTIQQTYQPNTYVNKGDEKGFFAFGGSSMVLLIEPNRLQFDQDLLKASAEFTEVRCLLGQSLGHVINSFK